MDTAVGKGHRLGLLPCELGILALAGDGEESLLRLFNGFDHRGRHRRSSPGATGNWSRREIGVTQHDFDVFVGNAGLIVDDLRKDGVSTGADVLRSAGDTRGTIVTK